MGALYILDTSVVIGVVTNNVCGERKLNNFQISSNKLMDIVCTLDLKFSNPKISIIQPKSKIFQG